MPPAARDVRYDSPAMQAIDDACEKWERADDAIMLIEYAVARDPTEGKAITESGGVRVMTLQGAASIRIPTVTYLYEFDDRYITVREALFSDAKPQKTAH